mgnify:CR=1 FL=1
MSELAIRTVSGMVMIAVALAASQRMLHGRRLATIISQGADIVTHHTDSTATVQAASKGSQTVFRLATTALLPSSSAK